MPARNMKTMQTHWMKGPNAAMDAFFVLKPPVGRVVSAWFTASKPVIPPSQ